jgi:hypothetical protein
LLDTSGNGRHLSAGSTAVTFTEDGPPIGATLEHFGTVTLSGSAGLDLAGAKSNADGAVLPAGADLEVFGSHSGVGVANLSAIAALSVAGSSARSGAVTLAASVSLIIAPTGEPVDAPDTPPERTFTVYPENREFAVAAESRTWEA